MLDEFASDATSVMQLTPELMAAMKAPPSDGEPTDSQAPEAAAAEAEPPMAASKDDAVDDDAADGVARDERLVLHEPAFC